MIAVAVESGGEGDCFFFSLYEAARARGKVAEVEAMFVSGSRSGDDDDPKMRFVMCVRRAIARFLRRQWNRSLVTKMYTFLLEINDPRQSVDVKEALNLASTGVEGSAMPPQRIFAHSLANYIRRAGNLVDALYISVVYEFMHKYDDTFADSPVHDTNICLYVIPQSSLAGFRIPETGPLVVMHVNDNHYQAVTMVKSRIVVEDAPDGPPHDSFFYAVYAAAKATNRLRRLGWNMQDRVKAACYMQAEVRIRKVNEYIDVHGKRRHTAMTERQHMSAFTACMRTKMSDMIHNDASHKTGACVLAAMSLLAHDRMSLSHGRDALLTDMMTEARAMAYDDGVSDVMAIAVSFAMFMSSHMEEASTWAPAISAELMNHMFSTVYIRLVLNTPEHPASQRDLHVSDNDTRTIIICTTGGREPIYSFGLPVPADSYANVRPRPSFDADSALHVDRVYDPSRVDLDDLDAHVRRHIQRQMHLKQRIALGGGPALR